ncbi:2812_t:CDS:2 [Paraglomus occultum]|uniref:2812_t:CDS:1 n=1 Tax=Paraglomus occultum TaxID=144539 RepID=A0A9N9AVT9_9GLOM|nr:2812_t:CDS:2 [Paraglomus occultum]
MNSTSPRYSPTPPAPNLGDFGTLLRYLESEKQKWLAIDPSADISSLFPTSSSNPPQLPHSSSSEYSSEEEMIERTIKAVQKRVRVLLHPSDDISSGNEKEKREVVHFTPSCSQAVISSQKQKQKPKPPLPTPSSGNSTQIPIPIQLSTDPIHVFIDNSNILMGFYSYYRGQLARNSKSRKAAGDNVNTEAQIQPRLSYDALFTILERGRNVTRKVLVASSPLYQDLTEAEATGYEVSVLERIVKSNSDETHDTRRRGQYTSIEREQCVDELLHLKILQSLLEYHPPATLVLASGDGNDGEYFQGGFRKCVVMALNRGWKVEIISWQHQLSHNFLQPKFLHKWKGLYHVVFLDWFAKELGCTY